MHIHTHTHCWPWQNKNQKENYRPAKQAGEAAGATASKPVKKKTKLTKKQTNKHAGKSKKQPNNDGDLKFMFQTMLPASSLPPLPPKSVVDKKALHTIRANYHECICTGTYKKYPEKGFADETYRDIVIASKASGQNYGQVQASVRISNIATKALSDLASPCWTQHS